MLVKGEQTDKDNKVVYLYATDMQAQYSFIEAAKAKGYDVLNMDGQLDIHFVNFVESKKSDVKFARVDSDVIDRLIRKDDNLKSTLPEAEQSDMREVFTPLTPSSAGYFHVSYESMGERAQPMVITQSEFMRRMKDMSAMGGGGGMNFYGTMPDSFNLVVNTDHPLVKKVIAEKNTDLGEQLKTIVGELEPVSAELNTLKEQLKGKKDEEIEQAQKDKRDELEDKEEEIRNNKKNVLTEFGKTNQLARQLVDLALLANNMLKGEELNKFICRSVDMIK
jgi:molecular chaperone HtpG